MTHDELLERIGQLDCEVNKGQDGVKVTAKGYDLLKHSFALLAVVELAATYKDGNYVNEEFNQGLQTAFQLIIEAIEKELL